MNIYEKIKYIYNEIDTSYFNDGRIILDYSIVDDEIIHFIAEWNIELEKPNFENYDWISIKESIMNSNKIVNELNTKIAEAKAYLASTDYKMTLDYDKDVSEVKIKRAEAREFIRENE